MRVQRIQVDAGHEVPMFGSKPETKQETQFVKLVLKQDEQGNIVDSFGKPVDLNMLKGSLAFSRDTKHIGMIHKLIYIGQQIHSWVNKRDSDYNLCHGLIITDPNPNKKNHVIVAHAVDVGIRTGSRNYLNEPDVTEMVIYIPKDPHIRELLLQHASYTAFNPKNLDKAKNELERSSSILGRIKEMLDGLINSKAPKKIYKSPPGFSYINMVRSVGYNKKGMTHQPSEKIMKRTAYLLADLLLKQPITNKEGKHKSMFCAPYALSLLQASMLLNELDETQKETILNNARGSNSHVVDRDKLATHIFDNIKASRPTQKQNRKGDELSLIGKAYWSVDHKVCRLDTRFILSSYAAKALDKISHEVPADELAKNIGETSSTAKKEVA